MSSIEFTEEIYTASSTHYIPLKEALDVCDGDEKYVDKLTPQILGRYGYERLGDFTKLFFDIDGKGKELMDKTYEFKEHLDMLLETGDRKFVYCYCLPEEMEEASKRENKRKLSFHVIFEDKQIKRIGFKPEYEEDTLKWLLGPFYDTLRKCVDKGVYDKSRKLRLPLVFDDIKPVALKPCDPTINLTRFAVNLPIGVYKVNVPLEQNVELLKKEQKSSSSVISPKKRTEEDKQEFLEKLRLVKKERFRDCGWQSEWAKMGRLIKSNGLDRNLFLQISKESAGADYDEEGCLSWWFSDSSSGTVGFPVLNRWLEEDGVDWKSMFCRKKQGMVQDLLKAWREFGTLTDMSIAEIFFKHYSDSLYYTDAGWLHYTEKNGWEMGNPDSIVYPLMKFIGGGLSTYVASLKPGEDEDEKKFDKKKAALMKECVGLCSYSKCAKVIKTCQGLFKNNDVLAEFDQIPHWFCFSDFKAIDMKTGDVVDVKKEHKILTTCGYPLPERDEKEVERAKEFVLTIVEEKAFDSYMSMLACSFYGDPNLNQKVFIHTGSGGNGKSLMTILLQETLGNYAGILPIEQLTKDARSKDDANSSLAAMRGKRYAQLVEPEDDRDTTLKVAKVKELTGESKIKVRSLFKESIDMFISFTLNIFCNEKPKLSKFDGGIERRLGVFPYEFRFVDEPDKEDPYQKLKNPELGGTIKRDKSFQHGFLYLCLDHWRKNNGIFISNDSVKEANKVYMRENNKVVSWLDKNYKPSNGKDFVRVKEVFVDYSSEPSNEKITMTSFTTFISSLGYKTVEDKSNGRKVYLQKIIRCEECGQDVDVCGCGDRKKFSAGMKQ